MKLPVLVLVSAAALGGCATTTDTTTAQTGFCNADHVQGLVGQKADAAGGLAIRQATGATVLRWGPPRSAMTMDFRQDRVTVAYDDAMIITSIACG